MSLSSPSFGSLTVHPCTTTDENRRRYYLDVMGIQCWELRNAEGRQALEQDLQTTDNRDVISAEIVTDENNWPQLETAIQQCEQCQLSATRKQAIAGRGNQSAELMFVLLAPGSSDDEAGTICSGKANDLFSKMLAAINVPIEDVYITSLLKCKVPARHTVSPQEIKHCHTYLKQQIQLIQPELLIVLGETTIRCLLQKNLSLDDFRAMNVKPQFQVDSVPVFVSYSPQELLQQAENKRKAWSDLQLLQKMISN